MMKKDPPKTFDIVDAVVAYDNPMSVEAFMLQINQAIHVPYLQHNLLSPMQMRVNRICLDKEPKFLVENPMQQTHAIAFDNKHDGTPYLIPLLIRGIVSLFPTRKPTIQEYERADCIYALTQEEPEWDPLTNTYKKQEEAMCNTAGKIIQQC